MRFHLWQLREWGWRGFWSGSTVKRKWWRSLLRLPLNGAEVTAEIDANPQEVAELRAARERVRRGEVRWLRDGESVLEAHK